MSDEGKTTVSIFGIPVGTCCSVDNHLLEAIQFHGFKPNEKPDDFPGFVEAHILEVDFYTGDIAFFDAENKEVRPRLCMWLTFASNDPQPFKGVVDS